MNKTAVNIIETKDLTKNYGKERGIVNLNLTVKQGEIFGFIGPNGSGKSTTIRTLLGLIRPTSGSAKIFNKDIATDGPDIRQQIGYLPSEVFYYDGMRAIELLKYSASFYIQDKSLMNQRIQELARLLDLDLHKKIEDLSYGNKKKVGIIQGLLHRPKLIILDEPTGGLDPLIQQTFFQILREENKQGTTILFSSHILSEVQKLCTNVAIIKDGSIIKVENIHTLRETQYKKFKIEMINPHKSLFTLPSVSNFKKDNQTISFLYRGNINDIIKLLAKHTLGNVWIEEPDLEEIFMHYYQKDS